jgi:RND family efflux transporter MFP subunit
VKKNPFERIHCFGWFVIAGLAATGCHTKTTSAAGPAMQAMPVQTVAVTMTPVPQSDQYVATIKSRQSATLQPQVSGILTQIHVHSGDHVKAGQPLMEIDERQQQATVASLLATERQKKALYDYNQIEVGRDQQLFAAGVTSRDAYQQEQQAFQNAKADYESAVEARKAQQQLLDYYIIRAPFDGVLGDIPVHVGDYVSPSVTLTTLDENQDLEAYVYVPAEHARELRVGLPVNLLDSAGHLLERTRIDFVSPQVDSNLQAILAKAPVHETPETVRNAQMVNAQVIWSTKPMAVVPVLAVTRQGGQTFVFVAQQQNGHYMARELPVTLGATVGNAYSVSSGLTAGDRVIVSGTQFLVNNMPVAPLGG